MKNKLFTYHRLILLLITAFAFNHAYAQQDYYARHLLKGKNYYYNNPPKYVEALKEFDLAKNYISPNEQAKMDTINLWNNKTREAIVLLYQISENEKAKALREKQKAEDAQTDAELARNDAEKALAKTTRIINAFYFYEEQFALAYKNNKYGFINKDGEVVIDYKYEEAAPFDYTGLARVKRENQFYLIDNKKTEYELSTNTIIVPSTKALDLSNQQLTELPETVLSSTQLEILLLNGNEIRYIKPSISRMHKLSRLYLYNNDLKNLPPSIGELSNLILLDVGINDLTEIPPDISQLTKLTELILYDNSLIELPESIGQLNNLFFLDLSKNLLSMLPEGFKDLKALKILAISDNQFKEVPLPLKDLSGLKMLDLGINQIESIPDWIGNYPSLTHLHIRNNMLDKLPGTLQNLDSLKEFIADNNLITGLPDGFGQLKNIEVLDLSYNQLTNFPDEILELPLLSALYLSGNSIQTLPGELTKLSELKKIDLSSNQLSGLPDNIYGVENLEELVLMDNKLTLIPKGISKLLSLKTLDIRENPDLDMAQSLRNMVSAGKQVIISAGNHNLDYLSEDNRLLIKVDHLTVLPPEISGIKKLVLLDLADCKALTAQEIENTFKGYAREIKYTHTFFPQIGDTNSLLLNVDLPVLLELDPMQLKPNTNLKLSFEGLSQLPVEIGELTNLETLDLSHNKLKTLPLEIGNLSKLKELYLDSNELSMLPEVIKKLVNLEIVSLKNNPLSGEVIEQIKEWLPENCRLEFDEGI